MEVDLLTLGEGKRRGLSVEGFGRCFTLEAISFREDGTESRPRYRIVIELIEKLIGAGAVAHELTHAAVAYIRLFFAEWMPERFWCREWMEESMDSMEDPASPDECPEELLAYLISNMCSEFWGKYYARGYHEKEPK